MSERDEFYVGWHDAAPPELGRGTRRRAAGLLLSVAGLALLWAAGHSPFPGGTFEYGEVRELEGTLLADPWPALLVARPGDAEDAPPFSRYPLVRRGKAGVSEGVRALDGRVVRVSGTLVHREGTTMLELAAPPVPLRPAAGAGETEVLGVFTLTGEIVDAKCYLGVMNPGNLKTHRSCAVRCISGGIPPALVVRDEDGRSVTLLLADAQGRPVEAEAVRDRVAEPVEIRGRVVRLDDLLVLHADPAGYRDPAPAPEDAR